MRAGRKGQAMQTPRIQKYQITANTTIQGITAAITTKATADDFNISPNHSIVCNHPWRVPARIAPASYIEP